MRRAALVLVAAVLVLCAGWRTRRDEAQVCAANLKTLAGAMEMYNLDK